MKTMFAMGFRPGFESRRLGQDWGSLIPSLITTGANVYGQVNQADIAEQNRKAAIQVATTQAQAAATAAAAQAANPTILGMNRDVAIMGGIGLIALVGLVALLK